VQPHNTVLDLCASPGCKTMQLLEAGAVVFANDVHPGRIAALRDALRRHGRLEGAHGAEGGRLVLTQGDAMSFPMPRARAGRLGRRGFHRVLADVPCSGDGTVRKDRSVLPRWSPEVGNALHATQLGIALQGLRLTREGGRMVYSTCSLNPVEDEAVVAAVLREVAKEAGRNDALEILPWPHEKFPGLRRRDGTRVWTVADHVEGDEEEEGDVRLRTHDSYETGLAAGMKNIAATMWPPPKNDPVVNRSPATDLRRCSRFLPHDNDGTTGGFFVAILHKRHGWNVPAGFHKNVQRSKASSKSTIRRPPSSVLQKVVQQYQLDSKVARQRLWWINREEERSNDAEDADAAAAKTTPLPPIYFVPPELEAYVVAGDLVPGIEVHHAGTQVFRYVEKRNGYVVVEGAMDLVQKELLLAP